ncbi:hypothetical protein GUJ93_ZPchr0011g27569 [Zizania palustris]|uniref:Uncharacterized protein n=1 Tax=Zizania palustris TaxID=103762 RepID=A0A8J5WJW3_ZIZPA|nr:hypothetical protein GUJ93_ZPchr0011g27569 [Zizania palustris]
MERGCKVGCGGRGEAVGAWAGGTMRDDEAVRHGPGVQHGRRGGEARSRGRSRGEVVGRGSRYDGHDRASKAWWVCVRGGAAT